jgi:hypothetical protein
MSYVYETTPYGVKQQDNKFVVHQFWWGKDVSEMFDTKEEAQQMAISLAKTNGCLQRIKI